jgi:hypothetical protein
MITPATIIELNGVASECQENFKKGIVKWYPDEVEPFGMPNVETLPSSFPKS